MEPLSQRGSTRLLIFVLFLFEMAKTILDICPADAESIRCRALFRSPEYCSISALIKSIARNPRGVKSSIKLQVFRELIRELSNNLSSLRSRGSYISTLWSLSISSLVRLSSIRLPPCFVHTRVIRSFSHKYA